MRYQKLWARARTPLLIVLFLFAFFSINSYVSQRASDEAMRATEAEDKARAVAREAALKARKAFDPATCKHGDRRYVYWAARDQVFRFRYRPDDPVYAPTGLLTELGMTFAYDEVPPAPDPSEPQGCFGNPIRGGGVPYMERFTEELFEELTGRKPMVPIVWGNRYLALPERLRRHPAHNVRMKTTVEQRTSCWQRAPALRECLNDPRFTDYHYGRHFRSDIVGIDPAYVDGGAVYFNLGSPTTGAYGADAGKYAYTVRGEFDYRGMVRVTTQMYILLEDVNQMPMYFNEIIRHLAEAHIPGYQWTTNSNIETKGRR